MKVTFEVPMSHISVVMKVEAESEEDVKNLSKYCKAIDGQVISALMVKDGESYYSVVIGTNEVINYETPTPQRGSDEE